MTVVLLPTPLSLAPCVSSLRFTLIRLRVNTTEPFPIPRHGRIRNCPPPYVDCPLAAPVPHLDCSLAAPVSHHVILHVRKQEVGPTELPMQSRKWDFVFPCSMPYEVALRICISVGNQPELPGKLRPRSSRLLPFSSNPQVRLLDDRRYQPRVGNSKQGLVVWCPISNISRLCRSLAKTLYNRVPDFPPDDPQLSRFKTQ